MAEDPLPYIDDVVPFGDDDRAMLNEIRSVLARHGALERVGITLLHSHFDTAEDEVMVERVDRDTRVITVQPLRRTDLAPESLVPTSFRLSDPRRLDAVQYCYRPVGSQFHQS